MTADARRESRVALVLRLVERFVYDLGLLMAGRPDGLNEYLAPPVLQRLRDAIAPLRDRSVSVQPIFSEYAQVRIEGDLLDLTMPLRAVAEFDDRSTITRGANLPVHQRRHVRLLMVFDPPIQTVVDHRIDLDDG